MRERLANALASGTESVVAWADILDRINVFPVPDGDTGRNLVISLSPFKQQQTNLKDLSKALLLSARGNSGNIAARFFTGFILVDGYDSLFKCCERGRDLAYKAIKEPKEGTMLSIFDSLVESLRVCPPDAAGNWVEVIIEKMEETLLSTKDRLPELKRAGVIDSGALGMFVFFESCMNALVGQSAFSRPIVSELKTYFNILDSWREDSDQGYCMDVVLKLDRGKTVDAREVGLLGESVLTITEGDLLKVHLHAQDMEETKRNLQGMGEIVSLASDDLGEQTQRFLKAKGKQALQIMTDAAGSITREDASELGITLLDSYLTVGGVCLPETYVDPLAVYASMRKGIRVSTSQASVFERHRCYQKVMNLYGRVLYICVGSYYTGNYEVASDWKADEDPEGRMILLDSGSASGRLGLAVLATASLSLSSEDQAEIIDFAKKAVHDSQELIFLDRLQYLAAGGRMSKTGAFFGDVLNLKPVVTPAPDGAKKVAVVRNKNEQVDLAVNRLSGSLSNEGNALIMLEYTDNRDWVGGEVRSKLKEIFPKAVIMLQPLSLTSAVHMGPGTWGVAYLPVEHIEVFAGMGQ